MKVVLINAHQEELAAAYFRLSGTTGAARAAVLESLILSAPCDACGAIAGEECNPLCLGLAAQADVTA